MKRIYNLTYAPARWMFFCILALLLPIGVFGQLSNNDYAKKSRLKISVSEPGEISLRAVNAKNSEVADELSKRLKIPVVLSKVMSENSADLEFESLPLLEAAQRLAPHARIDSVLNQNENGDLIERPLAVYLSGYNEPEPTTARSLILEAKAIVIEGDTETLNEPGKSRHLQINFVDNLLTVSARRQNLSFLISEIAARANLEFDLRYDSDQLVNVEIQNQSLTEALARLSPQVQIYRRYDLLTGKTTAFRVALVEPKQSIKKNK